LLVLALATRVDAAPTADVVVIWAPGMRTAPVVAAARGAGAAVLDQSPTPEGAAQTAQLVQKGLDAFERLDLDQSWQLLESARSEVDRTGAAGLTQAQLSDLFLYRGLIKTQQGDTNSAWEELVVANTVDPTRELDPGRFPPKIIAEFERAQATVKNKGTAKVTVTVPAGCRYAIDATTTTGPIDLILGRHWSDPRPPLGPRDVRGSRSGRAQVRAGQRRDDVSDHATADHATERYRSTRASARDGCACVRGRRGAQQRCNRATRWSRRTRARSQDGNDRQRPRATR
jgi:hypothetical protein